MTNIMRFMPSYGSRFRPGNFFEPFGGDMDWASSYAGETDEWLPPADIAQTEKHYMVTIEVPGIDMKNLDMFFTDGVLTIKGEKDKEVAEVLSNLGFKVE